MGQRMLEEPGRGGTEKEGFGCSAELHNQPGGLGGCSEGPALEKKVTKKVTVPWEGHPHSWFTFPRCMGRMRALSAGKSQHQSLR